jgi:hypothetical protein
MTRYGIALVALLVGCAASVPAAYLGELEACRDVSPTCERYVSCRQDVAAKYHQAYDGGCTKDGAAE